LGRQTCLAETEYQVLIKKYPDADPQYRLLYEAICNIEDLAGCTPAAVGESAEWTAIVNTAEDNRASYCKALSGSSLQRSLWGLYIYIYIFIYSTAIGLLPGGSVYKRTYIQQGNHTYISRIHTAQHK
jgi:hypothetical protein